MRVSWNCLIVQRTCSWHSGLAFCTTWLAVYLKVPHDVSGKNLSIYSFTSPTGLRLLAKCGFPCCRRNVTKGGTGLLIRPQLQCCVSLAIFQKKNYPSSFVHFLACGRTYCVHTFCLCYFCCPTLFLNESDHFAVLLFITEVLAFTFSCSCCCFS